MCIAREVLEQRIWVVLYLQISSVFSSLKALFNNVFTLKNLSYMSLHAISVFDKV